MKRKAKLMQAMEPALDACQVVMVEYRACVCTTLPPSPVLETSYEQLLEAAVRMADLDCLLRLVTSLHVSLDVYGMAA